MCNTNLRTGLITARETRTAGPTSSVAEAVIEPDIAVIVKAPTPVPVANPLVATAATVVEDELQVTVLVTFCVPSTNAQVKAD